MAMCCNVLHLSVLMSFCTCFSAVCVGLCEGLFELTLLDAGNRRTSMSLTLCV